ncbi:hypothetical protein [Roseicella aquatilis]|uniref:Uncharacterized protein n=1 Tax=Roseicella aquatilis TaxID=2527868 RepID=A0A4R4DTW3_9PROT|nr:hypothetical protein [Roseicella aquatilis]TCZ63580.1 hypothetical protein EXY23_09310 [Roseicella aquatilis]
MMLLKPDASAQEAERATSRATPGRLSDIRGVIDNATPDRLYGWAWDFARPAERVRVVLRIAGETLAEAVADGVRPDLADAGIGDGCHAFELPLDPAWRDRLKDLAVVALGADGHEFPIAVRLPRREEPAPAAAGALQRTMEGVIAEQRDLRRALDALQERANRAPEAATLEETQQRLAQIELWLTRLDGRLAELSAPAVPAAARGLDPWQAVLYALLASLSVGALAAAVTRWLA